MPVTQRLLDVIEVSKPCPVSSAEVPAGERERFCLYCQRRVHNLSAMTSTEAERLVCDEAAELCVQFDRDAAGRIVTLDYQTPVSPAAKHWPAFLAPALVTTGLGVLLVGLLLPTRTRGAVCRPRPPATAPVTAGSTPATAPAADEVEPSAP